MKSPQTRPDQAAQAERYDSSNGGGANAFTQVVTRQREREDDFLVARRDSYGAKEEVRAVNRRLPPVHRASPAGIPHIRQDKPARRPISYPHDHAIRFVRRDFGGPRSCLHRFLARRCKILQQHLASEVGLLESCQHARALRQWSRVEDHESARQGVGISIENVRRQLVDASRVLSAHFIRDRRWVVQYRLPGRRRGGRLGGLEDVLYAQQIEQGKVADVEVDQRRHGEIFTRAQRSVAVADQLQVFFIALHVERLIAADRL